MDLINIFRTFHQNAEEYTFSGANGTFSRIDHILGHKKSNFGKFKKIKTAPSIFSNHNAMRLDIKYKKKTVRNTKTWRLNNTFINNRLLKKSKGKSKNLQKQMTKHDNLKPMGCSKRSSKREVYSNTTLPQETRKASNRKPNFTSKTGKRTKKLQNQQKERNHKDPSRNK